MGVLLIFIMLSAVQLKGKRRLMDLEIDQLPLSLQAKLNQTVITWEFPVLNVYLLV